MQNGIRKAYPQGTLYHNIDFQVPIGLNGDCMDRYLIRIAEFRQSINIILQALNLLPRGVIKNTDSKFTNPSRSVMNIRWKELFITSNIFLRDLPWRKGRSTHP